MYKTLVSWSNLLLAFRKAAKGKRGIGKVAEFERKLEDNLYTLHEQLSDQSYKPGPYSSFYIHEPKRRLISAAPFPDRVVHHALCNCIEPIFEPLFIADSYANRVGKGTHRARDRAQYFARRFRYVLHADVQQFFPSIDHEVLKRVLYCRVLDQHVRNLVDVILEGGKEVLVSSYDMVYFPGDDLWAISRPRGLPIGNLTSQFFANVYLNDFDHFVKRELGCNAYIRYVDDFLLFADNKSVLLEWKRAIEERLQRFRLTIHSKAQSRPVSDGFAFLGFVIFPEKRRLLRRKGVHYRSALRRMIEDGVSEERIKASIEGWENHARYANSVGLRKSMRKIIKQ